MVPAAHHHAPGAGNFKHPVFILVQHLEQALDLALAAGDFDHQRSGREIDYARAEYVDQFKDVRPRLGRGRHLDQCQFAAHRGEAAHVIHLDHVLQLVERRHDAVAGSRRSIRDQGHARDVRTLRTTHGDRGDIDVQPAEQRRYAGKHTRLIFHVGDECVLHGNLSRRPTPFRSVDYWPTAGGSSRAARLRARSSGKRCLPAPP